MRAEVLAVVDPLGRQSALAARLEAAATRHDLRLSLVTQRELVAGSTIRTGAVGGVVEPDRPLLWLAPPAPTPVGEDPFVAWETHTAARAVAFLTRSPVLNRPTATAPCGSLPGNRALAVRRAERFLGVPSRPERFRSSPVGADVTASDEVFDYGTGLAGWGVDAGAAGPFRIRPGRRGVPTRVVRVVGDRVVAGGPVTDEVADASIRVAAHFDLELVSLWWTSAQLPRLARIECWHYDGALGTASAPVADAVCAWLSRQVGDEPGRVA